MAKSLFLIKSNDGQPVPDDLVAETLLELERRFGAVSSETQTIRGLWRHEGESYRDDLIRVFLDVADEMAEAAVKREERPTAGFSRCGDSATCSQSPPQSHASFRIQSARARGTTSINGDVEADMPLLASQPKAADLREFDAGLDRAGRGKRCLFPSANVVEEMPETQCCFFRRTERQKAWPRLSQIS